MDRLWTPWRFHYVSQTSSSSVAKKEDCVFCSLRDSCSDDSNYILSRNSTCFVILNLFPYTTGHLMVVPYRHLPFLTDLDEKETAEMMSLAQKSQRALQEIYRPQGFNMGINMGCCAGAGIENHIHLHLLPRWSGDSNFMTVVSETRVLPETLACTYQKLLPFFSK